MPTALRPAPVTSMATSTRPRMSTITAGRALWPGSGMCCGRIRMRWLIRWTR
jgi:hypothetical protein